MSKLGLKIILLAALLIAILAWAIFTQGPLAPLKVTSERIQAGNLETEVFGVGLVEARRSYNISSVMTGRIKNMLVDQGDLVKAGQVLVELDPIDLDEKLASSRLMAERSSYAIKMAEAQLVQAQSQGKTLAAVYQRYSELHAKGFVSQEMLDAKLNEKTSALAALEVATATMEVARRDYAKAQLDATGMGNLRDQTRLTSPVDGIVTVKWLEQGVTVVPGQIVLQVIAPGDLWVKTRIEQQQSGLIRTGQKADIVLRSHPQTSLHGTVERINLISDTVTEERIVNVSAAGINASLGEYAEVTIKLPALENAQFLSTAAVKRINQQDGIWVLQDGRAKFKPVQIGISTLDGRTQILGGVSESDEVVVYSQQAIKADAKLKVVSEVARN